MGAINNGKKGILVLENIKPGWALESSVTQLPLWSCCTCCEKGTANDGKLGEINGKGI